MDYSNKWPYMDTWEQPTLVFKLADVAFFFFGSVFGCYTLT